ncbi:cupin domain protein [Mobiluncus mulieris 28-1]|nr:cupin domain protein [Mobiluncus mulieris ATCC 35243]EEZ91326.1 cupin domain protein [Mobiluncus mulieris 28-1]
MKNPKTSTGEPAETDAKNCYGKEERKKMSSKETQLNESSVHLDLLNEIPVGKESTTSRVLINNSALRVVVFSFDKGEMLTAHSSPRAVVVQLLAGKMTFTLDDTPHHMVAGDMIYLAPGQVHALVADEPCQMSLVMVDVAADS